MGYYLQGLIVNRIGAASFQNHFHTARGIQLEQQMVLFPMTPELKEELESRVPRNPVIPTNWLTLDLDALLREAFDGQPFTWIEADYFGGDGEQRAIAFLPGNKRVEHELARLGPINDALRSIGVRKNGTMDEFDSIGLNRHRDHDDWLAEAR